MKVFIKVKSGSSVPNINWLFVTDDWQSLCGPLQIVGGQIFDALTKRPLYKLSGQEKLIKKPHGMHLYSH